MQVADNNGNCYPHAYTRNITNSSDHVLQTVLGVRDLPSRQVSSSAYYNKYLFGFSNFNPYEFNLQNGYKIMLEYLARYSEPAALASPDDENHRIVFVYDLDEITMLSERFRSELTIMRPDIDTSSIETLITKIYQNIDPLDVENIEDVYYNNENDVVQRVAPKYDAFKKFYKDFSTKLERKKSVVNEELIEVLGDSENKQEILKTVKELQKVYNQRWKCVEKCLKIVKNRSEIEEGGSKYANIVISDEDIVESAAQITISSHSSFIPIENVYSTRGSSKQEVFERIQKRFGRKCFLMHITSLPPPTNDVPFTNNTIFIDLNDLKTPWVPIWSVVANESFEILYKAQRDNLLRF